MSHESILDQPVAGKTKEWAWETWKLHTDKGRQYWEFIIPDYLKPDIQTDADWEKPEARSFLDKWSAAYRFDTKSNPNSGDRVFRYLASKNFRSIRPLTEKTDDNLVNRAREAAIRGFDFYSHLQTPDGNWPGDYGGPLFLTPGLVIASYITKTPFPAPYRSLMIRYFLNHQNQDGGWGLHIEDRSTMFGTVLQYVALRLLGTDKTDPSMLKARNWIIENGGATLVPSWGKFYLSVLGVYEWEGNNSLFPEMWLLPKSLPIHAWRYWCHCRLVYLPMSYCFANRVKGEITPLVEELREELYTESYSRINWKKARFKSHPTDQFFPVTPYFKVLQAGMNFYEKIYLKPFRKKAVDFMLDYMNAEDEQTSYINIGPVNQAMNSICMWHAYGPDSEQFKHHVERWYDFLWVAEDGIKMNGYNGSQLWDTGFAGLALLESGLEKKFERTAKSIYNYLDITQAKDHVVKSEKFFRSASKGTWPFSTAEQAWPVTDCTAEAMKTALMFHHSALLSPSEKTISRDRLLPAVDMLLSYQNKDGGWASYEETRGPEWLEQLNPAELFGEIMIEHSYVECSSATIQGLVKFKNEYPDYRRADITEAIRKGENFIRSIQRKDGSWYGSWAVCFTYGTWFGIEGLIASGARTYKGVQVDDAIRNACEFLASKQNSDGSWGESYLSSVEKKYISHKEGQVINTAWAVLALMAAKYPKDWVIRKGIEFILRNQESSGDWPQQGISGVFNHNCMITYTAYRNVFPLWALGRFTKDFGN